VVAAVASGIALALAVLLFALEEPSRERITNAALGAVGVLLTWMVAVTMRVQYPGRPLAPLLFVLSAVLACFPALSASSNPYLFTLTRIARPVAEVLLVWVMLAFPSGRLPERIDRLLLGAIAGAIALLWLPAMAFTQEVQIPGPYMVCRPECPRNVLFVHAQPELAGALFLAFRVAVVTGPFGCCAAARLAPRPRNPADARGAGPGLHGVLGSSWEPHRLPRHGRDGLAAGAAVLGDSGGDDLWRDAWPTVDRAVA
jgi:hypothetical protein